LTRLVARKTEDRSDLVVRLTDARRELMAVGQYQYVVGNGELARAVHDVSAIIDAETARPSRVATLDQQVHDLIGGLENEITRLGGEQS